MVYSNDTFRRSNQDCDVPARLPANAGGHGAQRQPEQQDGVEQRHRNPLPKLPMVEEFRILGNSVEGGIGFAGHISTRPERETSMKNFVKGIGQDENGVQ